MGSLSTVFNLMPSILLVLPVAGSPIHTSMPVAVVFAKANCFPSAVQRKLLTWALGASDAGIFAPSESLTSVIEMLFGARCRPLVRGLMRNPASRSMGSETSAMDG